jgi:predicted nucleic acid-binding Zn ribbon protein
MDLEANAVLLPSERCHACMLRRQRKTTRRFVRLCLFIAYNILVLSVVLVILWYFNNRLSRVEKDIGAILEQRNAQVENHKTGVPPPLVGACKVKIIITNLQLPHYSYSHFIFLCVCVCAFLFFLFIFFSLL